MVPRSPNVAYQTGLWGRDCTVYMGLTGDGGLGRLSPKSILGSHSPRRLQRRGVNVNTIRAEA